MKKYPVLLSYGQKYFLNWFVTTGKRKTNEFIHARILLLSDEKKKYTEIKASLNVGDHLIHDVRKRFCEEGLQRALKDRPRSGRPRKVDMKTEALLILIACHYTVHGRVGWTIDLLREMMSIIYGILLSRSTIQRILKANKLKPWRVREWCNPRINSEFMQRLDEILELYGRPYRKDEPVICIDEKSFRIFSDAERPLPLAPKHGIRTDYTYKRGEICNIFVCVEPKGGIRIVKVTKYRKTEDFMNFVLNVILFHYRNVKRIHLVMDNLNTHSRKNFERFFGKFDFFGSLVLHYTPKHASWLDQAEIEIGILQRQCLKRRFDDINILKTEIEIWTYERNDQKKCINWTYSMEKAAKRFGL